MGFKDTPKAIKQHYCEDGWVNYPVIDSMGRTQQAKFINEPNLYRLITHSKLPSAEKFEKWVFEEVLPSIRKTGKYETPEIKQRGLTKDDYMRAASIVGSCRNERMPYVLNFLEGAGFSIPKIEEAAKEQREDDGMEKLSRLMRESSMSLCELSRVSDICKSSLSAYLKQNRWVEDDAYVPKPGDYIFYDWDDKGIGDCTGWPEHIGIVVSVYGSTIKVVEGNKDNAVGYREVTINGRYIRGYGLPDYASKAAG